MRDELLHFYTLTNSHYHLLEVELDFFYVVLLQRKHKLVCSCFLNARSQILTALRNELLVVRPIIML